MELSTVFILVLVLCLIPVIGLSVNLFRLQSIKRKLEREKATLLNPEGEGA